MVDLRERDVVRQVLDYLAAERRFAIRLNTGVFFLGDPSAPATSWGTRRRVFRAHNLGRGTADVLVVPPGAIWIECKASYGRQRPEQKQFEQWVIGYGHKYILTRSVDDLAGIV